MLEFVAGHEDEPFELGRVQRLIERLQEWHPSGLYNPDRYALQLHVAASGADEALRAASDYHAHAAQEPAAASFSRAEVLTLQEFEQNWQDMESPVGPRMAGSTQAQTSVEVYTSTRALLNAPTLSEVTDILVDFVVRVGGRINIGERRPDPAILSIELPIGHDGQVCAVAESFSVAGLILERWLPPLLEDARHVMALLPRAG